MSDSPLHKAAKDGNTNKVRDLIKGGFFTKGADVHAKNGWNCDTPLHLAAGHGHKETAQVLLANAAHVDVKNSAGNTPLHCAAWNGHEETALVLLTNGADVHAKNNNGRTPLHCAAINGHKKTAHLLLTNGADVHAKNNDAKNGETPLHEAARADNTTVVRVLIANGADLHAKANDGKTPLDCAGSDAMRQFLCYLTQQQQQQYPPHRGNASGSNQEQMAQSEEDQLSLATIAQMQRDDPYIQQPQQEGAGVPPPPSGDPQPPVAGSGNTQSKEHMCQQVEGPPNTLLHDAARDGDTKRCRTIIKGGIFSKGADVNTKGKDGLTPLHWAAMKGREETAQVLITKGADVQFKANNGQTSLDLAWSPAMQQFLITQQQQHGQHHPLLTPHGGNASPPPPLAGPPPLQAAKKKAGKKESSSEDHSDDSDDDSGDSDGDEEEENAPPPLTGPPSNNAAPQPQRQLSDFSIDFNSTLGAGGSATVYKAFDNVTKKPVAVKVQPVGRLDAEAKLLTQLKHPNIVQVLFFDDGAGSGASKLFLELVDGGSLDKVIESSAPLPEEEIRRYLSSILQALDCVHTQSPPMCHRDVKPANMLLAKDGTLKLTDFGCARVQGKTGTTATLIAGTWVCLAPEACLGKPCAASDLWATACSVLHMATGRTPWHETGVKDVTLAAHISKPNPPLNHYPTVPQSLSAPLQALLRKMFAHNPEDRGTAASHLKDTYFTNEIPSNPAPTAGGGSGSAVASVFPQWLQGIPVPDDVRATLLQHRVDETSFELLDVDDLKEMGVAIGPRKILLNEIAKRKAE